MAAAGVQMAIPTLLPHNALTEQPTCGVVACSNTNTNSAATKNATYTAAERFGVRQKGFSAHLWDDCLHAVALDDHLDLSLANPDDLGLNKLAILQRQQQQQSICIDGSFATYFSDQHCTPSTATVLNPTQPSTKTELSPAK
jgi:hypothetical protein